MKKENLQQLLKEAQDQLKQLDDRKLAKEVSLFNFVRNVMHGLCGLKLSFPERTSIKGGNNQE